MDDGLAIIQPKNSQVIENKKKKKKQYKFSKILALRLKKTLV